MQNFINSLENNLKELYRKAMDADSQLNELKKQGHAKFETVFKDSQLFTAKADKFMPYLEEVAEQILNIKNAEKTVTEQQQEIETVVKKLHLLHTTLANFKGVIKA